MALLRRRRTIGPALGYAVAMAPPATGGGPSAEVAQFFARITTPSGGRATAYATLIDGLVAAGVWTKIDGLYIMAAADSATARTNLKQSSYGLTANGGMTFSTDQGYTGNGSTGWMNTGYDPSTAGGNFPSTGNTGTMASYNLTHSSGFLYDMQTGGNVSFLVPHFAGDIYAAIGGTGPNASAGGTAMGSSMITRTSTSNLQLYKNGATTGAANTSAPVGGSSGNIALFSTTGGGGAFSDRQMAAAMFGGALNGTQALAFQSLLNGYMTTLGINKY